MTSSSSSVRPFLIPMVSHTSSPKRSNVLDGQDLDSNLPPPYEPSSNSPLLLAETTTTRTETVTTTTTETTTHLFSLPSWKKRNAAQPLALQQSSANYLSGPISSNSAIQSPYVDKALPPTPPEPPDTQPNHVTDGFRRSAVLPSPAYLPEYPLPPSRKASSGTQSAAVLAHAGLGIGLHHVGLPRASASFTHPEANSIPFTSASSPSSPASVRRVKSTHRVQARHVSETQGKDSGDERVERRTRGLSFSTGSFLNIGNSDTKGKGKELAGQVSAPPEHAKIPPKPLARKTSFWNRRKLTELTETTSHNSTSGQGDSTILLPPLPPVHHVSPFDISDFSGVPPISSPNVPVKQNDVNQLSRSHSDSTQFSSPSISPELSTVSSPIIWPTSNRTTPTNDGIVEPLQSNGNPALSPRPRRQTSTPLLHRLSLGVFSSGESSPTPSVANNHLHATVNSPTLHIPRKSGISFPKPLTGEDESPEGYLSRLKDAVSKSEVAGILASSSDPFHARALREYINQFEFLDIPLDVALRKLLMEVGLPRETQQIDRVMEAFAFRYMQCNPDIFTSDDHPYILAFSLIMLHTDAFNPSNKRKMTKPDYIKNTKLPGIPTEVLDCFFDNIVFAPFIFIEDPVDFNGQPGLLPEARSLPLATPTSATSLNGAGSFKIGNRVDPYYMIINDLLQPLRVDVSAFVPLENPFTYEGTGGPWDEQQLHQAFVNANIIEIDVPLTGRSTSIFNRSPVGRPTPSATSGNGEILSATSQPKLDTWNLKITKVGLLNRKDDMMEGGRKSSNRKWKTWSVILTGSQLLLFRDLAWATALSPSGELSEQIISPPSSVFRPDESFSVKDAIAVFDRTYAKYNHAMRFVLPDGRQLLLQASDENDLNEWISRINYASTFKTAGVRMRPQGLSSEDALLTGVAAATSHLHDMQKQPDISRARSWDSNAPHDLMDMLSGPPSARNTLKRRVTMANGTTDFDLDVPVAPEIEGAEQFKATFDQVKADLAADDWPSEQELWLPDEDEAIYESPLDSPTSMDSSNSRLPSRSQIIQSKIREVDSKIAALQPQLDSDMRFIRNIAILTPFQKSTRSRLSASVQAVAKRITQLRLEMEKLKCHRFVLRCDLSSEGRSWNYSKQVALRVAKKTLQTRRAQTVPKMTLALPDSNPESSLTENSSRTPATPASQRPSSSPCDSFHTALESTSFRWPSSESVPFLTANPDHDRPTPALSRSSSSFPGEWKNEDSRPTSSSLSSDSDHISSNHNNDTVKPTYLDTYEGGDDDLAEEWNRTRCAQRVSLIHVPSNIRISTRLPSSTDS